MLTKILYPTDFSDVSMKALEYIKIPVEYRIKDGIIGPDALG